MKIKLANPRGFCAGVDRAIDIVNRALALFSSPIYVRHEVVHNKFVVKNFINRGVVFFEELHQVPDDVIVIFSAHGVSKAVEEEANRRGLKVFDSSCPLVKKVHMEVIRYLRDGMECVLIGHNGHPEVEGTMGQCDQSKGEKMYLVETVEDVKKLEVNNQEHLAYVTQTTLSMNDTAHIIHVLRQKFTKIKGPSKDDICYATQNRQDAVRTLTSECDTVFVVGSINSSNSNRLCELAERNGAHAYLLDRADDIKPEWLEGCQSLGITAGASAPEVLVQEIIHRLIELGAEKPEERAGKTENIVFSMPKELKM